MVGHDAADHARHVRRVVEVGGPPGQELAGGAVVGQDEGRPALEGHEEELHEGAAVAEGLVEEPGGEARVRDGAEDGGDVAQGGPCGAAVVGDAREGAGEDVPVQGGEAEDGEQGRRWAVKIVKEIGKGCHCRWVYVLILAFSKMRSASKTGWGAWRH